MKKKKACEKFGYAGVYNRYIKRCIDFIIALILLIPLLPIYAVISAAILAEDGFPIVYAPYRGGYKGKPFRIFKFRTMVKNADKIGGGTTALNDPRITKTGAFLRKVKGDELLQAVNVLLGTMAFIGPRPELLQYTSQYTGDELDILKVRPGITDYSSIEFINLDEIVGAENADEMYEKYVLKRKNELRVKYAREVSFKVDCKLFFSTIAGVVKKTVKVLGGR